MCHLRKSVHNNKDGILSILSSRQTKYKIHANIFPWLVRNWKRHIETMGLSFRLSFATCRASVGEAIDVAEHLGPKVVLGERSKCLVASKVSHESASMSLLQKEQTKRRLGNAKFVSSHKIIILDVIAFPRCIHKTIIKTRTTLDGETTSVGKALRTDLAKDGEERNHLKKNAPD